MVGAGEMVQCLFCEHEDLSLDRQYLAVGLVVVCVCDPSAQEAQTGRSLCELQFH